MARLPPGVPPAHVIANWRVSNWSSVFGGVLLLRHADGAETKFVGVARDGLVTGTCGDGQSMFRLTRDVGGVVWERRPQTPVPPFPYRVSDVSYPSGGVTLAGTLTVPPGPGPFPAVVLVGGSGRNDRDYQNVLHRPFLLLADAITRAGVAVLRTDKRGCGASGGEFADATLNDFAADAAAGVAFLRARPEVAADRVGILGHSEGAWAATLAASRTRGVAFVIVYGCPGVPMRELIRLHAISGAGLGPAEGATSARLADECIRQVLLDDGRSTDQQVDAVVRRFAVEEGADPRHWTPDEVRRLVVTWLAGFRAPPTRFLLRYDPLVAVRALSVPVLVINGGADAQVVASRNLPPLREALRQSDVGDATVRLMPGLNHMLQHCRDADQPSCEIDETMSPEVLELTPDWITSRFGAKAVSTRPAGQR